MKYLYVTSTKQGLVATNVDDKLAALRTLITSKHLLWANTDNEIPVFTIDYITHREQVLFLKKDGFHVAFSTDEYANPKVFIDSCISYIGEL